VSADFPESYTVRKALFKDFRYAHLTFTEIYPGFQEQAQVVFGNLSEDMRQTVASVLPKCHRDFFFVMFDSELARIKFERVPVMLTPQTYIFRNRNIFPPFIPAMPFSSRRPPSSSYYPIGITIT
jgi:hypothetical protein